MFKKQAIDMIKKGYDTFTFNESDVPKTTTTTKKTTTTTRKTTTTTKKTTTTTTRKTTTTTTRKTTTTTTRKTTTTTTRKTTTTTTRKTTTTTTKKTTTVKTTTENVPAVTQAPAVTEIPAVTEVPDVTETSVATETSVIGDNNDNTVPEDEPVVGKPKELDPDQVVYTPEELETLEKQVPDKEEGKGNYEASIGTFSIAAISVSGAAGIGLLVLKKKNPGKYSELKQKFPEAFGTIKRGVTRSATSIKRGVTRTATSIRRKNSKPEVSRHGNNVGFNYREMPDHMFGEDGLPRIQLHDDPVRDFPNPSIRLN